MLCYPTSVWQLKVVDVMTVKLAAVTSCVLVNPCLDVRA